MARVKGGYLGGTYDVPNKQPLDSRMLVTKKADLINPSIWKTNGSTSGEFGHYNGMIVSVNGDGNNNGVYYLTNRSAITSENYSAYNAALAIGADVSEHFSMWTKLGALNDLVAVENKLQELIGDVPDGKTITDMIAEVRPSMNLYPVDGTIIINNADNGDKMIGVAIAPVLNNALTAVEGGLFVPTPTAGNGVEIVDNKIEVKLVENTHGLVAVDGALSLNLATKESDGAMSKEDKAFLDTLRDSNSSSGYVTRAELQQVQESVAQIAQGYTWGEME